MITRTNAFVVILDTCVLAPMPLCDTLLRLAEDPAFYMPRWSAGILDELRRVLLRMQYSSAQAERRITASALARIYHGLLAESAHPGIASQRKTTGSERRSCGRRGTPVGWLTLTEHNWVTSRECRGRPRRAPPSELSRRRPALFPWAR
jgi:hypothetical protein